MNREEIVKNLADSFEKVFQKPVEITDSLSAHELPEWDSLTSIQLMSQIEEDFEIEFSSSDMLAFEKVGDLIAFIEKKTQ